MQGGLGWHEGYGLFMAKMTASYSSPLHNGAVSVPKSSIALVLLLHFNAC